jgi:hypothetical protein
MDDFNSIYTRLKQLFKNNIDEKELIYYTNKIIYKNNEKKLEDVPDYNDGIKYHFINDDDD